MATSIREQLLDDVVEQIQRDLDNGDTTAIYELLEQLPDAVLEAYLPEEI
jgi:hypothetical protein